MGEYIQKALQIYTLKFTQDELSKQITEAKKQLAKYNPKGLEKGIVVVFNGWEMVYCKEVQSF